MLKPGKENEASDALEMSMAAVAAAMSDPSRMKMLCALMDGRAWTATELSAVAEIASSTASAHLTRLVNARLISCLSQGRHRYYRLAGQPIAGLIETLMGVSWQSVTPPTSRTPHHLRAARSCYDHLAGELAVHIYDFMTQAGWLTPDGSSLTDVGRVNLAQMGIFITPHPRRKACCACLDWSERRFHPGGEAGAALFEHCLSSGWLTRVPGFREVSVTAKGRRAFSQHFAIHSLAQK